MVGFTSDQLIQIGEIGKFGDHFYAASGKMFLGLLDRHDDRGRRKVRRTDNGFFAQFGDARIDVTATRYCRSFDDESGTPSCDQHDHAERDSCYMKNYYCDLFQFGQYAFIRPGRCGKIGMDGL